MFKTGLVSISFRNHSAEEIIHKLTETTLEYVEWGSDVHAPFNDFKAIDSINRLSKEFGVKTSSYGTYFKVGRDNPDTFVEYTDAAKRLNTDVLRVWIGTKSSCDYTEKEKDRLYEDCIVISELAAAKRQTVCCECHPNTLTDSTESTLELMKSVNMNNFKMYWQPNQFKSVDENIINAKSIAPYTVNIHVFNWLGKERYPLIKGIEIWKKYLDQFDKTQKLLLEFMPDDSIDSLPYEAEALQKII
ncbi:MAG: hypothetical protein K6F14_05835 [Clostridiales bacterium]|nr:hypothetical protein [Clostridiales bacterium]